MSSPVTLYNQSSTPTVTIPLTGAFATGDAFVALASGGLATATFRLARSSDLKGTVFASLFAGAAVIGGALVGEGPPLVSSQGIDATTIPSIDTSPTGALVTFSFPNLFPIQKGGIYAIVVVVANFSGTALYLFTTNTNLVSQSNLASVSGIVWNANTTLQAILTAVGLVSAFSTITVATADPNGIPLYPVTVELKGPGYDTTLTSQCPNGFVVFNNVPAGDGFELFANYTDATGQSFLSSTPPFSVFESLTLPSPLLSRSTPNGPVRLIHFKVKLEHHLTGGEPQMLTMLMENQSSQPLLASLAIVITLPDGTLQTFFGVSTFVNTELLNCDFALLQSGEQMEASFTFTPPILGLYDVAAAVLYDTNLAARFESSVATKRFDRAS